MTKILIADLFGTLIPSNLINADYLYSRGIDRKTFDQICDDKQYYHRLLDDIYIHLARSMSQFLEEGNYLKIVSGLDSHDGAAFTLNEMFLRLYKYLESYSDQIEVFLVKGSGANFNSNRLQKIETIENKEDLQTFRYDDKYNFVFLDKKIDVFDIIAKQYNLDEVQLYCVGDTEKDLEMLVKCMQLGGQSAFIKGNLYTYDRNLSKTTDNIIWERVDMDYHIMLEDMAVQTHPDYSNLPRKTRINIIHEMRRIYKIDDFYKKRSEELYTMLKKGELNLDEMIKQREIYDLISWYYKKYTPLKTYHENKVENLILHPNFQDYYKRVLVKSENN